MTIPSKAAAWDSRPAVAETAVNIPAAPDYLLTHDSLRAQVDALRVDVAAQQALFEELQARVLSLQARVTRTEIRLRLE